jgi:hypothetical protein
MESGMMSLLRGKRTTNQPTETKAMTTTYTTDYQIDEAHTVELPRPAYLAKNDGEPIAAARNAEELHTAERLARKIREDGATLRYVSTKRADALDQMGREELDFCHVHGSTKNPQRVYAFADQMPQA